jgi:hypothetical protein
MARFLTTLRHEKIMGKRLWLILEPLVYESDVAGCRIEVPTGFLTDLASVPRLPLAFLLTGDSAHEAAVIHDWAYKKALFSRELADAVFAEAGVAAGEPEWKMSLMHFGVRMGGWIAWNNHRQAA